MEIRNFENLVSAHVVYVIAKLVISRPCKDVKDCNMNKKWNSHVQSVPNIVKYSNFGGRGGDGFFFRNDEECES